MRCHHILLSHIFDMTLNLRLHVSLKTHHSPHIHASHTYSSYRVVADVEPIACGPYICSCMHLVVNVRRECLTVTNANVGRGSRLPSEVMSRYTHLQQCLQLRASIAGR